ncbi:MAG TPA: DUF6390 family protein [Acidimicrobiia bacterium]
MEETGSEPSVISGPELFFRYAQPPNRLGYCGPNRGSEIAVAASGDSLPFEEAVALALAFDGAWPYLELIASLTGHDPLSRQVVEAYWMGTELLDGIDLHHWGHSISDRFKTRAGSRWPAVLEALNRGGSPTHAFHVFCVYPWVGLLRSGFSAPAVEVLDRCRIAVGEVMTADGELAVVRRRPLIWEDDSLRPGAPIAEPFRATSVVHPGDVVSLHWDYICQRLDPRQKRRLIASHDRHLQIANDELRRARMEPAH